MTSITGVLPFTTVTSVYRGNVAINDIIDHVLTITVPTWFIICKNESSLATLDNPCFCVVQVPTVAAITQQVTNLNSISAAIDSTVSSPSAGQILTYQVDNTWKNATIVNPYNTSYARLLRTTNGTKTLTNTNTIGALNYYDVFTSAAADQFFNTVDTTAVNNRQLFRNAGATSYAYTFTMECTTLFTGNSIYLVLNGTNIIHSAYTGISGASVSFTTQPFTLNANDWIGVACSASFQTIQNPAFHLDMYIAGGITSPTAYVNSPLTTLYWYSVKDTNAGNNYVVSFSSGGYLNNLTGLPTVLSNDVTKFV